jgi:predicted alpha-1,2-mannosidase
MPDKTSLPHPLPLLMLASIHIFLGVGCSQSSSGISDALVPEIGIEVTAESVQDDADKWKPPEMEMRDLAALVSPLVGTDGSGNVVPGAQLPHGVVKLSPDSTRDAGDLLEYEYDDPEIHGFSHTHLHGGGGSGYGYNHLLVTPLVDQWGELPRMPVTIDHDDEEASPGYFAATLVESGVRVELTASRWVGFHRLSFPAAKTAELRFDLAHSGGKCVTAEVEVVPPNIIRGQAQYQVFPLAAFWGQETWGSTGIRTLYFHAETDQAFDDYATWNGTVFNESADSAAGDDIGAMVSFATDGKTPVQLKVALSLVSILQAEKNMQNEIPLWDFDAVRGAAREAWNERLNRVHVDSTDEADLVTFYSAFYRTFIEPVDYTEHGVTWIGTGNEGVVVENDGRRFYADDWCIWDTFRTSHPWRTVVEPETASDIVDSMLRVYELGGWLPKCPWQATGYSRMMIGNHAIPVIVDFFLKGLDDFDQSKAYEAAVKLATQEGIDVDSFPGMCGYVNLGTVPEYLSKGYVSMECDEHQSVSMTLEYAFDDWCLSRFADALGEVGDAAKFRARSGNYKYHWNDDNGFMQARHRNGDWLEPFDPDSGDGFCEADSWKYSWSVPHDIEGLIDLMGGDEACAAKLDEFFAEDHFTVDNQPGFHVPYLYNFVGQPWKTQLLTQQIARDEFGPEPDGLPGNDDAGSTSAWYLFAAAGFYPVCPCSNRYELTVPLFDRVAFRLHPTHHQGQVFLIEVTGRSAEHTVIGEVQLNGQVLDRFWISHEEIAAGGHLLLTLVSPPVP